MSSNAPPVCTGACAPTTGQLSLNKLRIAIIGQSHFGAEVYRLLRNQEHEVVGVFTVPDTHGRPDPLAQAALSDGVQVFKFARWRRQGVVLPEVLQQYQSVGAELNVLPYCTQFIPMEVITHPQHQSIIYHPSLLPRHRGASAINWTLMQGDKKAGFTVFWADDGLDTGPILLQRECDVDPNDTVDSLYNRFLYPEGVKAMGEAVQLVADGKAPRVPQPEEGATYDPIMKKESAKIPWGISAQELHNFIRGNDKIPGAWSVIDGQRMTFFGSHLWTRPLPRQKSELHIEGSECRAIVHDDGLLLVDTSGSAVNVDKIQLESGKTILASKYGQQSQPSGSGQSVTSDKEIADKIKAIWVRILNTNDISGNTDFFKMGAGSMDVVRLVEEVCAECNGIRLQTDDVYIASSFDEFVELVVQTGHGSSKKKKVPTATLR